MSDSVYIGLGARQLEDSPEYQPISCVKLTIGGEDASGNPIVCQAGNPNSGRTIETSNPLIWDSSMGDAVAQSILAAVQGYEYKPFTADGAIINPAIEIGDAVEVGDVYSVIADIETSFTPLMSANISAPQGSDIDHEYPYESSENRELIQQIQGMRTSFIVENGRIAASIEELDNDVNGPEGLTNRVATVEMTARNITASLSAYATTEWVNEELSSQLSITAESITSTVSEIYETKQDATSKLDTAKDYADDVVSDGLEPDGVITRAYTSKIEQTAQSITSTVAAQESKWDLSALPAAVKSNLVAYGFGIPSNTTAANYNGKYYLDQAGGIIYRSNGTSWSRQSYSLNLITSDLQSQISQLPNQIKLSIKESGEYASSADITAMADSISLSVNNNIDGTTSFVLTGTGIEAKAENVNLQVNAVNVLGAITAKYVAADASIISPTITGGTIKSTRFADPNNVAYLTMGNETWSDGYLWYGPSSAYYPTRSNSYFWVRSYLNFVELAAGGASFMGTQQGSSLYNLYGMWNFEQCTRVVMPDGTVFARS